MAVDTEVLLKYLDCSFAKSVSLRVVGRHYAQVDVELSFQLLVEFGGKLSTTVTCDMLGVSM